jgi:hypothetical protein
MTSPASKGGKAIGSARTLRCLRADTTGT